MDTSKHSTRAGMSAQTSVEGVTATIGGHGGERSSLRVASGHTSDAVGAGQFSCNNTATNKQQANNNSRLIHAGSVVRTDSDQESAVSISTVEGEHLQSPRPITSSSKAALKEKAKKKAAIRIHAKLSGVANLSAQDKERLAWANSWMRDNQLSFLSNDSKVENGSTGPVNKKVESTASKRQQSAESSKQGAPVSKRLRASGSTNQTDSNKQRQRATVAETAGRQLTVALIDRGNGKISAERWRLTHGKLVEALFVSMEIAPDSPMPTFEGSGWMNGVKILKCKDEATLLWLKATVPKLDGLWEGAQLDVVDRNNIPSMPKAKVLFPIAVQGERALQLLKKQNPAIPTSDWSVLKVDKPLPSGEQHVIMQINKEAEDLLYKRNGKMAWGLGSVYLRLKKRHPTDKDTHTLRSGEVEADLGLESMTDATLHLDETEKVGGGTVHADGAPHEFATL
ncbi:uncharacterized protein LOC133840421 [Drosophila sulfurigaster albostrigata]|uniref:uncharacterized protein LOC133840421 n=1 Tax=Drosophila sulfurigaster albostrigata TaxID=89887 RepID=UPI002D21A203|nr:uncharacterized protein LOC133840421 [Drosophila sulfurigaster albostrigata]